MDEQDPKHQDHELLSDAKDEVKDMATKGLDHPSTKPVLTGAVVGAIAGGLQARVSCSTSVSDRKCAALSARMTTAR